MYACMGMNKNLDMDMDVYSRGITKTSESQHTQTMGVNKFCIKSSRYENIDDDLNLQGLFHLACIVIQRGRFLLFILLCQSGNGRGFNELVLYEFYDNYFSHNTGKA